MKKIITDVETNSLAERYGVKKGDVLLSLNSDSDFDIIDYLYAAADVQLTLSLVSEEGKAKNIVINNDMSAPIGLSFENITIDKPKVCRNKCIFCFMDQMPKGLRPSLYFKDDDYRLSFLYGNYITLTNINDDELKRIIELKLTPLNISVHTSNPKLRAEMMNNAAGVKIMEQLKALKEGGIEFNIQLVLCPGVNDGEVLEASLNDMLNLLPAVNSLSCVPVGLSKLREGLFPLRSFTKQEAEDVVKIVDESAKKAREISEFTSFCASDEFFLIAGKDIPADIYYGDYLQYENGVGMARSFIDGVDEFIEDHRGLKLDTNGIIVTGVLGQKVIASEIDKINESFSSRLSIVSITNDFLGDSITASGLVCGCDIIKSLKGKTFGREVLIPNSMLKEDEPLFLDNVSVEELRVALDTPVTVVPAEGYEFCEKLREIKKNEQ